MKHTFIRRLFSSALCVAAAIPFNGCASGAADKHPAPCPALESASAPLNGMKIENDWNRSRSIEQAATRLHNEGRMASMEKLYAGLTNQVCRLNLPERVQTATKPEEVYRNARPSVLVHGIMYKCGRCQNWHVNCATCFAITNDGVFVANHHAFKERKPELGGMIVATEDGRVFPVTQVLASSSADDVCIFKADLGGQRVTPLPLAPEALDPGGAVYVLSHPNGQHYVFTSGIVSRYAQVPTEETMRTGRGGSSVRMCITADYAKGSSGGPIMNEKGEVVGMVSSTESIYYNEHDGKQENLQMVMKFCVPLPLIRQLIQKP